MIKIFKDSGNFSGDPLLPPPAPASFPTTTPLALYLRNLSHTNLSLSLSNSPCTHTTHNCCATHHHAFISFPSPPASPDAGKPSRRRPSSALPCSGRFCCAAIQPHTSTPTTPLLLVILKPPLPPSSKLVAAEIGPPRPRLLRPTPAAAPFDNSRLYQHHHSSPSSRTQLDSYSLNPHFERVSKKLISIMPYVCRLLDN